MGTYTRRDFIRLVGSVAGMAAITPLLGGCGGSLGSGLAGTTWVKVVDEGYGGFDVTTLSFDKNDLCNVASAYQTTNFASEEFEPWMATNVRDTYVGTWSEKDGRVDVELDFFTLYCTPTEVDGKKALEVSGSYYDGIYVQPDALPDVQPSAVVGTWYGGSVTEFLSYFYTVSELELAEDSSATLTEYTCSGYPDAEHEPTVFDWTTVKTNEQASISTKQGTWQVENGLVKLDLEGREALLRPVDGGTRLKSGDSSLGRYRYRTFDEAIAALLDRYDPESSTGSST